MNNTVTIGQVTLTYAEIALIVVAVVAVAVGLYLYFRHEHRKRLRRKYGSEYDRLVAEGNGAATAEAELLRREKRVNKYHIRSLKREERDKFGKAWRDAQSRFVEIRGSRLPRRTNLFCA